MFDAIKKAAARDLPRCRDFLADLIATKSLSGGEGAVVARIRQEMESVGFDEVIDPRELRNALLSGLELASQRGTRRLAPTANRGIRP